MRIQPCLIALPEGVSQKVNITHIIFQTDLKTYSFAESAPLLIFSLTLKYPYQLTMSIFPTPSEKLVFKTPPINVLIQ